MKLQIAPGSDGDWTFQRKVSPASLHLPAEPNFGDVDVTVYVRQVDRQIRLEIEAKSTITTECYRCGETFNYPVDAEMDLRVIRMPDPNRDSGDDDLKFIGLSQADIDIEQDLRDMLLLALPMRMVCCE